MATFNQFSLQGCTPIKRMETHQESIFIVCWGTWICLFENRFKTILKRYFDIPGI